MFWDKTNSKKIEELATEIQRIKLDLKSISLDLELYTRKLKASKGLKSVKEELEDEAHKPHESVFLDPLGKPIKSLGK